MRRAAALAIAGLITGAASIGAPVAAADTTDMGDSADVDLVDIEVEQYWTISDLRPSADPIPFRAAGSLWEATATVKLPDGGVPMISGFSARSASDSYPVLWGVATPLGVPPSALQPGGSASGKLYFDVTAAPPDSVAYTADGTDEAVWKK